MSQLIVGRHTAEHANFTLASYVTGFITSIILTLVAFALAEAHLHHAAFSHGVLIAILVVLAFAQFVIQLWFFLHLGSERKPRWRLLVFGFMIIIVGILVIGSLWIMSNLNYRMLSSPQKVNQYLQSQDNL